LLLFEESDGEEGEDWEFNKIVYYEQQAVGEIKLSRSV